MSAPYRCPICAGRGAVLQSFYEPWRRQTSFGDMDVTCRSCDGRGIVWGDDGDAPQPAKIEPPQPWTPATSVTANTATVTYQGGALTLTAMQGPIPAGDRRSSVDLLWGKRR